ncbi:UNVERIFIED_ASMBLY: hypothetical protein E7W49_06590 [Cronobacter sakazakii]|nr:hypothetical protein [Cronobacter sakazakii]
MFVNIDFHLHISQRFFRSIFRCAFQYVKRLFVINRYAGKLNLIFDVRTCLCRC